MSWIDRMRVALRHIRTRVVESTLVIVATAVGTALVAAMVSFVHAYDAQTEYLLAHPAYRELIAEVVGEETQIAEPAVRFDATTAGQITLGVPELRLALTTAPAVAYGYLADATELSTGVPGAEIARGAAAALGGGMGAGGAMGGALRGAAAEGVPPGTGVTAPGGGERTAREFATPGDSGLEGEPAAAPAARFDFEQFFQTDPDVITDLPLNSFSGLRVTAEYFAAYGLDPAVGSLFTDDDVESGNQVLVLGSQLARTLFPGRDPLGTRVRLLFQTYTVIGILEPSPLSDIETGVLFDRLAFVPNAAARISFGGSVVRFQRPTRTLRFAVADSAELEQAALQLAAHFEGEYGAGAVRVTAPVEALRADRDKLSRVLSVVLFLASAGLFIASINLFNLMLMRVVKQTKGIGIMRALGGSRREIFLTFASESALMSVAGAGIGLAVSPVVYRLLASSLVAGHIAAARVSWPFLLLGALAACGFSLIFGIWPARQAAAIDASLAIRTE